MAVAYAVAIRYESWVAFGVGCLLLVVVLVVPNRGSPARVAPPRGLMLTAAALAFLLLVGAFVSWLGLAAPGRGRGLSVEGGGTLVQVLAWAAVLSVVVAAWTALWKAMGRGPGAVLSRLFWACVASFALAPLLFLTVGQDEDPLVSEDRLEFTLGVMAAALTVAAALPHVAAGYKSVRESFLRARG